MKKKKIIFGLEPLKGRYTLDCTSADFVVADENIMKILVGVNNYYGDSILAEVLAWNSKTQFHHLSAIRQSLFDRFVKIILFSTECSESEWLYSINEQDAFIKTRA